MRHYEFLFILKATLNEEEIKAKVELINATITKNGGEIAKVDELGIKSLAYEIEKNKRGYYTVSYFKAPPTSIKEIERIARLNEDLLRFLTVKYDSKKEVTEWNRITKPIKAPVIEAKVEAEPVATEVAVEAKEEVKE